MDVIVTGRHITITDEMRAQVEARIAAVEKIQDRLIRAEVQFASSSSKRSPQTMSVEITIRGKGPVIRAEGTADDKMVAFDNAFDRLKSQMRKAADRRKAHRGLRATSIAPDLSAQAPQDPQDEVADDVDRQIIAGLVVTGDGPLVVREKEFSSAPLTLAQALDEMELVGHDFFLYLDAATQRPSVVYRRKAYNYGVIHLNIEH